MAKYNSRVRRIDKARAEGNLHTIYGIARVPCDTHMREILDPVSPQGAPAGVHECLSAMATRQGAGSDDVP